MTTRPEGNISSALFSMYMAVAALEAGGSLTPKSRKQLGAIKTWATAMLNGDVPDTIIIQEKVE